MIEFTTPTYYGLQVWHVVMCTTCSTYCDGAQLCIWLQAGGISHFENQISQPCSSLSPVPCDMGLWCVEHLPEHTKS